MPNAIPMSQVASAQPRTISCTCSGRASVAKSRSAVGDRDAEQGVAHRAADEIQLMTGGREQRAQLIGGLRDGQQVADGPRRGVAGGRRAQSGARVHEPSLRSVIAVSRHPL